jgi:hypothetical protein
VFNRKIPTMNKVYAKLFDALNFTEFNIPRLKAFEIVDEGELLFVSKMTIEPYSEGECSNSKCKCKNCIILRLQTHPEYVTHKIDDDLIYFYFNVPDSDYDEIKNLHTETTKEDTGTMNDSMKRIDDELNNSIRSYRTELVKNSIVESRCVADRNKRIFYTRM